MNWLMMLAAGIAIAVIAWLLWIITHLSERLVCAGNELVGMLQERDYLRKQIPVYAMCRKCGRLVRVERGPPWVDVLSAICACGGCVEPEDEEDGVDPVEVMAFFRDLMTDARPSLGWRHVYADWQTWRSRRRP